MRGTPAGRFRRFRPDIPAAIAPEVTIRYSFLVQSNWSTIPRSRLISICPPGAMRLVPTLMTTRMFSWFLRFRAAANPPWENAARKGQQFYPAVRMGFLASRIHAYACFQRDQQILRSSRELRPLSSRVSCRGFACAPNGVRADSEALDCRCGFRHRYLDAHAPGKWQPGLCDRTKSGDAKGRRATACRFSEPDQHGRK